MKIVELSNNISVLVLILHFILLLGISAIMSTFVTSVCILKPHGKATAVELPR